MKHALPFLFLSTFYETSLSQAAECLYLLTYSIEYSPTWEDNRFSASQVIPHILWNPKVHYRIHKCLSLPRISSIQSITPHPTSWKYNLILSSHLGLGFPSGLFPSGFPTNFLYTPLLSPQTRYVPCQFHSYRFDHPYDIGWGVQIIKRVIM